MANIKISELNPLVTIQDADVLPIVDNAITKKVTAAILRSYTQGNSVLLTGAQTIAGIKTFTAQLASSVATGTAPFSVASTTKVTNLNADLLDGLSSADFQATLSGTGIVKSTAGTISYLTDNSTNWNTAFNDKINSAAVTGSGTNTLTLTQQDAGTITATWVNGTLIREIRNNTGATLTKGTIVYISGATGNKPTVSKAIATGDSTSAQTFGFVQEDILNNANGYVVIIGDLVGIDTSAYAEGAQLYLSSTTAGAFTDVKQYAPNHLVYVGIVTRAHPTLGQIEVNIQNGYELDELHNVAAQSPSNGDILQYVTSTGLWTKIGGTTSAISEGTNLYFTNARSRSAISLTTTGTSGASTYNSTTGVLNIPQYQSVLTNPITGTGTTNYLPKFTGASALGNSLVFDNGTNVGIGTATPASKLDVQVSTAGTSIIGYFNNNDFTAANKSAIRVRQQTGVSTGFSGYFGMDGNTLFLSNDTTATNHLAISTTGAVTLSSTLSTVGDATINGIKVGRGAGNISSNTSVGFEAINANVSGTGVTALGYQALKANTGNSNTGIGFQSLLVNSTATQNTAVGLSTLAATTTGGSNTAVGSQALTANISGSNNTAIGKSALAANTVNANTAIGFEAASANTSGVGITAIGYQALRLSTGANNTALGGTALTANTTGTSNTAIGFQSLLSNTTGIENTAIGLNSLVFNVSGSYNTAIGRGSLQGNTIGNNNTAVGFTALLANTANNNTAFGHEAATANTTGTNITAIGYQALKANTTGVQNTALGSQSLQKNTTGISNIGIGLSALLNNLVGNSNIAIGVEALLNSTGNNNIAIGTSALSLNTAANNTALGFEAAKVNTTGTGITAIGYQSLVANTGSQNTAIGFLSLNGNIGGNSNTAIGSQTVSGSFDASVIIGRAATATASNQFVVGSASYPAGAVATESLTSDRSWAVIINGTAYKILLKA